MRNGAAAAALVATGIVMFISFGRDGGGGGGGVAAALAPLPGLQSPVPSTRATPPLGSPPANIGVYSFAFDPRNPDTVYAAGMGVTKTVATRSTMSPTRAAMSTRRSTAENIGVRQQQQARAGRGRTCWPPTRGARARSMRATSSASTRPSMAAATGGPQSGAFPPRLGHVEACVTERAEPSAGTAERDIIGDDRGRSRQ